MVLIVGCLFFLNLLHSKNYKLAEEQSQDCKAAGEIPAVSNTWSGLGFTVTCKTKDTF
ncbi:hypothetical protein [Brevibacillus laterosporus]|uniref:hypothetical protein n=1 Tax=Brevibacillus laterosporus TaxID=1465 RepID=UPI00265D19D9|nr:hypothetical protein [Brevibacillus laterosporus]